MDKFIEDNVPDTRMGKSHRTMSITTFEPQGVRSYYNFTFIFIVLCTTIYVNITSIPI